MKLAALNKEICEEHPTSKLAQNSIVPRSQQHYITQDSEEIEGKVAKRLSREFSAIENRILGTLSRLDDFLRNPLIQGYSRTAPETSRNAYGSNQGTNEDYSQNEAHPEAGVFQSQITWNSGPEVVHDTNQSWGPKLFTSQIAILNRNPSVVDDGVNVLLHGDSARGR